MSRQPRAEAVQQERRRRRDDTLDRVRGLKLALPAEALADTEFDYRWINDEGSRISDLTVHDDWNFVTLNGVETAQEQATRRVVGTKRDGSQMDAYLVRKRKEWVQEDRRAKSAVIAKDEQAQLAGPSENSPAGSTQYGVSGSIKRGAYAP